MAMCRVPGHATPDDLVPPVSASIPEMGEGYDHGPTIVLRWYDMTGKDAL